VWGRICNLQHPTEHAERLCKPAACLAARCRKDPGDAAPAKGYQSNWMESCRLLLCQEAGWDCRVWDLEASEAVLAQHDPGFLEVRCSLPAASRSALIGPMFALEAGVGYLDGRAPREPGPMPQGWSPLFQIRPAGQGSQQPLSSRGG
jgi:hypothetical protein